MDKFHTVIWMMKAPPMTLYLIKSCVTKKRTVNQSPFQNPNQIAAEITRLFN